MSDSIRKPVPEPFAQGRGQAVGGTFDQGAGEKPAAVLTRAPADAALQRFRQLVGSVVEPDGVTGTPNSRNLPKPMRRRDLIAQIAGVAAIWPAVVPAQPQALPVVGLLEGGSSNTSSQVARAIAQGLADAGYVEGHNVVIQYRWADDHYDRLGRLADDLVHRQVSVIVTNTTPAALAAKAATGSIPIVFSMGSDPVALGVVKSLSRPEGNMTGIVSLIRATSAKRLELIHDLVPAASSLGFLVNPGNRFFAGPETGDLQAAAEALRVRMLIVNAEHPSEFEPAFVELTRQGAGGLVLGSDTLFFDHSAELVALADRYRVPTIYYRGEAMAAGGLMSYGTDLPETWRQTGRYAGRILKGESLADLPVQQAVKMRLAINPKVAQQLGLSFPTSLFARADEVIE